MPKLKLNFYDVKRGKKFSSSKYDVIQQKGRYYAVAKSEYGNYETWRVLTKELGSSLNK